MLKKNLFKKKTFWFVVNQNAYARCYFQPNLQVSSVYVCVYICVYVCVCIYIYMNLLALEI